jgi:hypothetical protein
MARAHSYKIPVAPLRRHALQALAWLGNAMEASRAVVPVATVCFGYLAASSR